MKYVKIVGLAAVAAMALMAFAVGTASATSLYNGSTTLGKNAELDFSATKTATLTNTAETEVLDECTGSTVKGKITNPGGANVKVEGSNSELTWTGCTFTTVTDEKGGLSIEDLGGTKGTVRSNAEIGVTISIPFFGTCKYGVEAGEHLGSLTTSASGTATFTANAVAKKLSGSSFTCPETSRWVASYTSTSPDNLRVEAS